MITSYEERLKELFGELQLAPYYVSGENLAVDRQLAQQEARDIFNERKYFVYAEPNERKPYKRRLFLHISGYLPPHIRGMTDTRQNIWINYNDYDKDLVLNHELIHVLHPEWPESLVREFHETYVVDRSQFDLIRN